MENSTDNHQKVHTPPRWCASRRTQTCWRYGRRPGAAPSCRAEYPLTREPLNWSLRRYVRASSLRVWLMRRTTGSGCANASADRHGTAGSPLAGGGPGRPGGETSAPRAGRRGTASPRNTGSLGARVASAVRVTAAAAESVPVATVRPSKQTYGTLVPGCGKPSRRCSARFGYHAMRARGRQGTDIGYFG
jgi:hypothetical protein